MLIVSVALAGSVPSRVIELGEMEQVDCFGAPVHVKVTVWLNPPLGVKVSVDIP